MFTTDKLSPEKQNLANELEEKTKATVEALVIQIFQPVCMLARFVPMIWT